MRGLQLSDNNSSFCAQMTEERHQWNVLEPVMLLSNFIGLMSVPVAILLLTMKDRFKTSALKTIILQEDHEFTLLWGGGEDTHTKKNFPPFE